MLEKPVRSIRSFSTVFVNSRSFLHASVFAAALWLPLIPAVAEQPTADSREFSGSIIKQVNGKKYQAQIFAKEDRLRFEYKYAIRTDYGYAGIEIIRLDLGEAWYLLAQRKELLVTPLDPDDVLPIEPALPGERSRTLIGEATVADRAAQLYEVKTDRHADLRLRTLDAYGGYRRTDRRRRFSAVVRPFRMPGLRDENRRRCSCRTDERHRGPPDVDR